MAPPQVTLLIGIAYFEVFLKKETSFVCNLTINTWIAKENLTAQDNKTFDDDRKRYLNILMLI